MSAPSIQGVVDEIVELTSFLVVKGFVDDQNYPVRRGLSTTVTQIQFSSALPMSAMLKEKRYEELYVEQRMTRSYNFRMLDGALVQMTYEFDSDRLLRSRLAFLPSPDLTEFQNDPELYMDDPLFAEVVDRRVVTVPIRFDFDDRPGTASDVIHPCAHVTLGQYKNCRIATTAPLTPGVFVGFILRSFYNTAINQISGTAPCVAHRFEATITSNEAKLPHFAVP
jgi:hypothetical protein